MRLLLLRRYVIATDLCNLRTAMRGRNQISLYFDLPPPSVEQYVAPREFLDGPDAFACVQEAAVYDLVTSIMDGAPESADASLVYDDDASVGIVDPVDAGEPPSDFIHVQR